MVTPTTTRRPTALPRPPARPNQGAPQDALEGRGPEKAHDAARARDADGDPTRLQRRLAVVGEQPFEERVRHAARGLARVLGRPHFDRVGGDLAELG